MFILFMVCSFMCGSLASFAASSSAWNHFAGLCLMTIVFAIFASVEKIADEISKLRKSK